MYSFPLFIRFPRLFLLSSRFNNSILLNEELSLNKFEAFVNQTVKHTLANDQGRSWSLLTYMTGALMTKTACHSVQFKGRMEKSVCKTGV